jgi:ATP-binding cassette subfamily B protein
MIELRNVSFRYPGSNKFALKNISFSIDKGQTLALVGKNGSGKTTLVKLLCRLYEPTIGNIFINGKDIKNFTQESYWEKISALFQDYGDYYLTVSENIGLSKLTEISNKDAIEESAIKSGIDRTIKELPNQYKSMLGKWFEDGVQLSGGEWQKIALARMFFRQGQLRIWDEPTTSLDAETESEIVTNINRENEGSINVLVSHRFSIVKSADLILVLENGECVETGVHNELMAKNGIYAKAFRLQANGYV